MSDKIYDRAWKLLADPSRWTQGCLARDIYGSEVKGNSTRAVKWCAMGAIGKVYGAAATIDNAMKLEDYLSKALGDWNDEVTHGEVVALLQQLDL